MKRGHKTTDTVPQPRHEPQQQQQRTTQRFETAMVASAGAGARDATAGIFFFSFPLLSFYYYTNVYFRLIYYLRMDNGLASRRDLRSRAFK